MNAKRRKEIKNVLDKINILQQDLHSILDTLESAYNKVENIRNEEQDCLDNIPENLQSSERYEVCEAAVDNLDTAYYFLDSAKGFLDDVLSGVEDAIPALEDAPA